MEIHIVSIFPNFFSALSESILGRAQKKNILKISIHDLRKWTTDERKTVDDKPFGGGAGMIMMLEPFYKAVKEIKATLVSKKVLTVLTSAKGKIFNQGYAKEISIEYDALIILCGHYEGVDERVAQQLVDQELSIGEYILTGGEIPAMIITDAVSRLIPGVLGNSDSLIDESHNEPGEVEYPQYTRPSVFNTEEGEIWSVPKVLLSGNHESIAQWRKKQTTVDL